MLKNRSLSGTPARTGNVAKTTGVAPRSPAHPRTSRSRTSNPWKTVATRTDSGRATTTATTASAVPSSAMSPSSLGRTSNPSVKNIASCATHARPSWKVTIVRLAGRSVEPMASPVRYTARNPDPWTTSVIPYASVQIAIEATGYRPAELSRTWARARTARRPKASPTAAPIAISPPMRTSMSVRP